MRRELSLMALAFILAVALGVIVFGDWGTIDRAEPPAAAQVEAPPSASDAAANLEAPILAKQASADPAAKTPPRQGPAPEATPRTPHPPKDMAQQIGALLAHSVDLENQLQRLQQRVATLEQAAARSRTDAVPEPRGTAARDANAPPVNTPDGRRAALMAAGVAQPHAEDIVWRQAELDLDRLELQDRAIREGWFRTDRYYAELRELNSSNVDLRAEIGDAAYDRYLFSIGEANRVQVSSVIPGSSAEQAGLLPGDVIESYAGERLFTFSDLRNATTQGERDEVVAVQIRRGDALVETWMPRGPIGVRLDTSLTTPDT